LKRAWKAVLAGLFVAAMAMPAMAATTDNFEGWATEATLTQDNAVTQGWVYGALPNNSPTYDLGIDANAIGGGQSLRISNAKMDSAFGDWLQSPLDTPATESLGGTEFTAEFDIRSVTQAPQAGLQISIAPQSAGGARMSFLKFVDTGNGIDVQFADANNDGSFDPVLQTIATNLTYDDVHHVRLVVDLYKGANNDVVQVYIDSNVPRIPMTGGEFTGFFAPVDNPDTANKVKAGQSVPMKWKLGASEPATTWEDYYRFKEESNAGIPQAEWTTRDIDSLIFQARQPSGGSATNPGVNGGGFYIDNLVYDVTAGGTLPTGGAAGDPTVYGTPIFKYQTVTCGPYPVIDDLETADVPGASHLTYDAATGIWHYNWQTTKSMAGAGCVKLNLYDSGGNVIDYALFKISK
jgi:hypothetical protein